MHLFLQPLEQFDKTMRATNQLPIWVSKFSYLTLLNLSEEMRFFGTMRLLWDGDTNAERRLPHVKGKVDFTKTKTWVVNLLRSTYQGDAVERSLDLLGPTPGKVVNNSKRHRTFKELHHDFQQGRALYGVDYHLETGGGGQKHIGIHLKSRYAMWVVLRFRTQLWCPIHLCLDDGQF
jgi:hypothetical protein